ncbi:MAG: hypothetical protein K0R92_1340 [Lachnospiraceae bacterium]|nr:hypothetical protein [Lachnospiraceae bacterium]
MRIQYKKIIEDIFFNLSKTVLIILAIALGVFGVGIIIDSYCVTDREMTASYEATNPSSFIITVDNPDEALEQLLKGNDKIDEFELRTIMLSRVGTQEDSWYETKIQVISNWDNISINTIYPLKGKEVPEIDEIIFENSSLSVVDLNIGDMVNVKAPKNSMQQLKISGTVQADGTNPAWMHEEVLAYISEDTMEALGVSYDSCEILITVSGDRTDKIYISSVAKDLRSELNTNGYTVSCISVPTPGDHPNATQMKSILLLFRMFGILSLLLSAMLVFSIISSIMKEQVKQIAIMKSMGATSRQITIMYYLFVIILGIVASIIAVPAATLMSRALCNFTASILVFTINDSSIPLQAYLIQIAIAILIPVLAATFPILRGCRMSVNKGLHDIEKPKGNLKTLGIEKLLSKLPIHSTGFSMGLRNTFRKPGRLTFAIITFALGGAILIASINVRASLSDRFDQMLASYNADTKFTFSENYSDEVLHNVLDNMEDIKSFTSTTLSYEELLNDGDGGGANIIYDSSEPLKQIDIVHSETADLNVTYIETEKAFREKGINVIESITVSGAQSIYDKHLFTVASFLIGASAIVILVGIISLVSLSGMSVTERMKELGIMRSFGTNSKSIFLIIFTENITTGLFGFIAALLLSIPLTAYIGKRFGEIFLGETLSSVFSFSGILIWLLLTVIINVLVSFSSIQKINKMPVYKVLSYE